MDRRALLIDLIVAFPWVFWNWTPDVPMAAVVRSRRMGRVLPRRRRG